MNFVYQIVPGEKPLWRKEECKGRKEAYFFLWNELPLSIRESNTLSIFRENLMAFYHDKCNVNFFKFYAVLY